MNYQILDSRIQPGAHMSPSTLGANSIDLRACISEELVIQPGNQVLISCGIKVELPHESMGMLIPRSGKGVKGLVLGNLVGNIDPDYRGEVKVCLWNRSTDVHLVQPMERVAQLVVVQTYEPIWDAVEKLSNTERAEKGFGSTGSE